MYDIPIIMSIQVLAQAPTPPIRINRLAANLLLSANGVTRTAVAREAGVHPWTVSRVLKNFKRVDPAKRMAVLNAIARLCRCEVEELVLGRLAA
jgi:hypothetical protein